MTEEQYRNALCDISEMTYALLIEDMLAEEQPNRQSFRDACVEALKIANEALGIPHVDLSRNFHEWPEEGPELKG